MLHVELADHQQFLLRLQLHEDLQDSDQETLHRAGLHLHDHLFAVRYRHPDGLVEPPTNEELL